MCGCDVGPALFRQQLFIASCDVFLLLGRLGMGQKGLAEM